jgi:hypothetical protein
MSLANIAAVWPRRRHAYMVVGLTGDHLTAATLWVVEGLVRVNVLGLVSIKGLTEPEEHYHHCSCESGYGVRSNPTRLTQRRPHAVCTRTRQRMDLTAT